ncbi:MAG: hypothetical protein LC112_05195 [Flavobacteriales bacterium]|nr:hypothetical protein [Flavobacteriales bacterium]
MKDFRQQILTQAVTGKLTARWREGKDLNFTYDLKIEEIHARKLNPIKLRGKDFFENAASLYTLPPSWKWVRLYKLVKDEKNSICAGPFGTIFKAKDFKETGIPIIFLKHVKKEGFNFKKPVYMDEEVWEKFHKDYTVNGGELLVTKLGDPPGEATIFPVDFGIAMVTPDVMKANIDNNIILTKFVSYFFNSSSTKEIVSEISFGMTRLRIDLGMFKMPIPTQIL